MALTVFFGLLGIGLLAGIWVRLAAISAKLDQLASEVQKLKR